MFRAGSVLSGLALVGVLATGIASANVQLSARSDSAVLSHEIFARCFQEDAPAPYALEFQVADALQESTLGAFAFRVSPLLTAPLLAQAAGFDAIPLVRIAASYAPKPLNVAPSAAPGALPQLQNYSHYVSPVIGMQPATTLAPLPSSAPSTRAALPSYRFDLPSANGRSAFSLSPVLNPTTGFTAGALGADANASLPQTQANVSVPMRVGHVHFQTHAVAGQAQSASLALRDRSVGGGATFDARLGRQKLGLDLSSQVEHLQLNAPSFNASSFDATSNVALGADHVPVFVPAYADVTKHTVSAGLAVPVSKRVTAALQVDSQHLLGGYGVPGIQNLDANNTIYGARVTYQFHGNAALSLSAKQYRFQDNLVPANQYNQTSANLNLTVKF